LHFILHFHWKVTWFWRSLTVCFSILVLYSDFVYLSLNILFLCWFLVFIDIFQTWISIICSFIYLFVQFYLIIFWNTKLKSKLFNQEINITFESKNTIWIEYLCDMIFQKYNSFLNMLNVSLCWIVIHSFNFSLWYSFKWNLKLDIYFFFFFFWNLNWFNFENQNNK